MKEIFIDFNLIESLALFDKSLSKDFLAKIYSKLLRGFIALKEKDFKEVEKHYYEGWGLLKNLIDKAPDKQLSGSVIEDDLRDIFSLSITICNHMSRNFDTAYQEEMLRIYEIQLQNQLLYVNGHLPAAIYKNIVTIALRLKKWEIAENIIYKYKDQVEPATREGVYTYNLAHWYLYQGDYKAVHKLLSQGELPDPYYHVGARTIRLKAYYLCFEPKKILDYDETYDDFIREKDNLLRFIRRNTLLTPTHKLSYLNFIDFITKLMKFKVGKIQSLQLVKDQIQVKSVFEKVWVLAQID